MERERDEETATKRVRSSYSIIVALQLAINSYMYKVRVLRFICGSPV